MSMNPFDWIRTRVRQSFIEGCADGMEAIDRGDVARLQERLTLALAAPAAAGDPSPAAASDATADAPAPATNAVRGGKRGAK